MLNAVRSAAKRVLAPTPKLYRAGKRVFAVARVAADRRVVLRRHPTIEYVALSQTELSALWANGFSSQFGQDQFLWILLGASSDGFFVDIGANDPIALSNSWYFEQQGWTGLAFDPLPSSASGWTTHRSCPLHQVAISERRETRDFIAIRPNEGWEHTLSGFVEFVRPEDMRRYGFERHPVQCAPLGEFLAKGQQIDLIMIDVEGAEELVLRGIDLKALRPRCVMVENVGKVGGSESLRSQVVNEGYRLVGRIGATDDVFLRQDLEFPR